MDLSVEGHDEAGLQLNLLGAPQIRSGGTLLSGLKSVKAQALLYYLAVSRRAHTRPALAGLLWGDMSEAAARANLRKALGLLRKHIGEVLIVERQAVSLDARKGYWVDVVELDQIFQEVERSGEYGRLQAVVDLYNGDFLDGFFVRKAPEFENWCLLERARLREQYLNGLQKLADYSARGGDLDNAIELMRRYLSMEPWREEAHRRLMLTLAQNGQRAAALVQYEICRRTLAEELDTVPSEGTKALFKRIQTENLEIVSSPTATTLHTNSTPPAFLEEDAQDATIDRNRVVGRENQIDRLNAFLEAALAGQGQIAFVSGEAGWGKTSLLEQFSRLAQQNHPDLIVALGTCTITTGIGDPYQPFREIIRMLTGDVEGLWAAGVISSDHANRLWRLLPETVSALVSDGPDLIETFTPGSAIIERLAIHESHDLPLIESFQNLMHHSQDEAQHQGLDQEKFFEEFTDVFKNISRKQPLLLILDDLHWADASSLGLLFHLTRKIRKTNIMILGAYRTEEVTIGWERFEHPLKEMLSEIKRMQGDIWVRLGLETVKEGRAFVDALIDQEPNSLGEEFRQKLSQKTSGHPLFTIEILREMRERGHLIRNQRGEWSVSPAITWGGMPSRVEGVIEKRIGRLAPDLREVLMIASVQGEEFIAEVIAQVQNFNERGVVSRLSGDLAFKHHLVEAMGIEQLKNQRLSRYRFKHNLFQKYVYDAIDPVERAYLHQAVGETLEALYQDQREQIAVQLGIHFQEAGFLDKATRYFKSAGDSARRIYAIPEAINHYQKAIELGIQTEQNPEDTAQLYLSLGRVLELNSQFDRALKTYQEMEKRSFQIRDRSMELASLIARVTILAVPTAVHDPIKARQFGERALALAKRLNDQPAEAKILWSLSLASFLAGILNEAIEYGEHSLTLARQLDLRTQLAHTLNDLGGFIYLYSGNLARSKLALKEAEELWRGLGNMPMLADCLSGSCVAHVYAGEFERAVQFSEQALQISREIHNTWGQSYSLWAVGEVYLARGEFNRAIEVMEECIRLGEMANFVPPQTYTRSNLAMVYAEMGQLDRAIESVQLTLKISKSQMPLHNAILLGTLARLQIKKGDLGAAEINLKAGMNEPSIHSWKVFFVPVLFAEVELACQLGQYEQALECVEKLIEQLNQFGMRSRLAEAVYLKGITLARLNRRAAAQESLLESRAVAEELGERRVLWRIFSALSDLADDTVKSVNYRRDANRVVDLIANHIKPQDLKNSFLNQPEISAVLAFDNQ